MAGLVVQQGRDGLLTLWSSRVLRAPIVRPSAANQLKFESPKFPIYNKLLRDLRQEQSSPASGPHSLISKKWRNFRAETSGNGAVHAVRCGTL